MDRKYSVLILAKYIINEFSSKNYFLNLTKLEILLYLLQVLHLRKTGELLFGEDIYIKANHFYIEKVDSMFCGFGAMGIDLDYPEAKQDVELYIQDMVSYLSKKYGGSYNFRDNLIDSSSVFNRLKNNKTESGIKVSERDMLFVENMDI